MTDRMPPRVRCRPILSEDLPKLQRLLARGFANRSADYWESALAMLTRRDTPQEFPRYGYLLECAGGPVGVLLMIFRRLPNQSVRCNISSWYVDPEFRGYASQLIAAALRYKDVTYVNISPAPHTWPTIEAQGFRRYSNGQILTIPALSRSPVKAEIETFDPGSSHRYLEIEEKQLLIDHHGYGCIVMLARSDERVYPFVFLPRRTFKNLIPVLQLAYCRDIADYIRYAGPIGRALLPYGHVAILIDGQEKANGVPGVFFRDRGPKYYKGPYSPNLGDLAYCESVLFGP